MNERNLEILAYAIEKITSNVKSCELLTPIQYQIFKKCEELKDLLMQVSIFPANSTDIVDRKQYLAVKAWSKEDIENKMVEMGYQPLKSTIEKICQNIDFGFLENCTDDAWNSLADIIKERIEVCNTEINYTYRDAANYKQENSCIIHGLVSLEQLNAICDCCDSDGETFYFIPSQVGLPEECFDDLDEDDHCWFEFDNIKHTALLATVDIDADELVKSFHNAKGKWDDTKFAMEHPEIIKYDC